MKEFGGSEAVRVYGNGAVTFEDRGYGREYSITDDHVFPFPCSKVQNLISSQLTVYSRLLTVFGSFGSL